MAGKKIQMLEYAEAARKLAQLRAYLAYTPGAAKLMVRISYDGYRDWLSLGGRGSYEKCPLDTESCQSPDRMAVAMTRGTEMRKYLPDSWIDLEEWRLSHV